MIYIVKQSQTFSEKPFPTDSCLIKQQTVPDKSSSCFSLQYQMNPNQLPLQMNASMHDTSKSNLCSGPQYQRYEFKLSPPSSAFQICITSLVGRVLTSALSYMMPLAWVIRGAKGVSKQCKLTQNLPLHQAQRDNICTAHVSQNTIACSENSSQDYILNALVI